MPPRSPRRAGFDTTRARSRKRRESQPHIASQHPSHHQSPMPSIDSDRPEDQLDFSRFQPAPFRRPLSSTSDNSASPRIRRLRRSLNAYIFSRERCLAPSPPSQAHEAFYPVLTSISHRDEGEDGIVVFPSVGACLFTRLGACPRSLRIGYLEFTCLGGVMAHHLEGIALLHAKLSLVIKAHDVGCFLGLERTRWKIRREGGRECQDRADRESIGIRSLGAEYACIHGRLHEDECLNGRNSSPTNSWQVLLPGGSS